MNDLAYKIYGIVTHTPTWVWLLLGYLVYRGITGLKTTTMPIKSLVILPTIFLTYGLTDLFTAQAMHIPGYFGWFCGFAIGFAFGMFLALRTKFSIDKEHSTITLPGSAQLLILLSCTFVVKYFFGYMATVHPDITQNSFIYILLKSSTNGLIPGIFLGRVFYFLRRYTA